MNHEAVARLNEHISNGTLTRRQWAATDDQGRKLVCLLAAMAPDCGEAESAAACPADVMPPWLAHLTPWIDDAGSEGAWPGVVRRYAAVAAQWHALSLDQWFRLEYAVRALCVREAMRHTKDDGVLTVCERVAGLCEAVAGGAPLDPGAFEVARAASAWVWAERAASAWAAARAARAARAATQAAISARAAVVSAASAAVSAASVSVSVAAAADRLVDAILGAIECACAGAGFVKGPDA